MSNNRTILLAVIVLFAVAESFSQTSESGVEEDKAIALVKNYADVLTAKNIDGLKRLWSASSPNYEAELKNIGRIFTETGEINVKVESVRATVTESETISVRAAIAIDATDTKTGKPYRVFASKNRFFEVVFENGIPKITRHTAAEKKLAIDLVSARSDDERRKLIADDTTLSNPNLTQALTDEADERQPRVPFSEVERIYGFALQIAEGFDNKLPVANALGRLGNKYTERAEFARSLSFHERALAIRRQFDTPDGISTSVSNIGLVYTTKGSPIEAIPYFIESIRLSESVNEKVGMFIDLFNLGNAYLFAGDHGNAMSAYLRSIAIIKEVDPNDNALVVQNNIGDLYLRQGNYQLAASLFENILSIAEKSNDKYMVSLALAGLAETYQLQKDYKKAIEYEERSLALRGSDNERERLISLRRLGMNYLSLMQLDKAAEYFDQALKLSDKRGSDLERAETLVQIAKLKSARSDFSGALTAAAKAKSFAEQIPNRAPNWEIYTTLGKAYQATGDTGAARQQYEKAIEIIEDRRTLIVGGQEEKDRYFTGKLLAYNLLMDQFVSKDSLQSAFLISERRRSRSLLDVLQNGKIGIGRSFSATEKREEQRIKDEIALLNNSISKENELRETRSLQIDGLQAELVRKRLEFEDFQTRLYSSHPDLKVQRGEMKPTTSEEAVALMQNEKTALAEFVVAEEKTFLFVITKNAAGKALLKVFTADIKDGELGKRVEAYRTKVAAGDLDFQKASRELYDLLLKPAAAQLAGKTNLIIVPDGPLWDLPFQTLQNEKNKYLIEQAAISYAPSFTALNEMSKKAKARKPDAGLELVAFGNPIVAKATSDRVKQVFMSEKLEPLPESERLVKELGNMYGQTRSKVYIGGQAREETAKTESPKYRIVQFATHGILNNVSPMYSHLVLAQNEKNPNEDGLLEAWEMKDLNLNADMVILSACDTARGKISSGEGVIGMSWAMFIAGTPTTVASQWKVESRSTTELMLEFHRQLLAGKGISKSEALRRASLKLMKMPQYKHPSYWAGFVMIGDGS